MSGCKGVLFGFKGVAKRLSDPSLFSFSHRSVLCTLSWRPLNHDTSDS